MSFVLTIIRRKEFRVPIVILLLALFGAILSKNVLLLTAIAIGLGKLLWESVQKIREARWSLDYIAMLAMATSLVSPEYYIAGAVVALMITLSGALEQFGAERAEASLKTLVEGIPKFCLVKTATGYQEVAIQEIPEKTTIFVKTNELVALDGFLKSTTATVNEANLTGESMPVEHTQNEFIKSGVVNIGPSFELETAGSFATSSYQKIVDLVAQSRQFPARIVRYAEKFNWPFTIATLVISGGTYFFTGDISRTLAVLAIATPCPLLIAAPIAFLAGMSHAAKKTIIIKKPSVMEILSSATTIFLDKTGTLTLGEPLLEKVTLHDKNIDEEHAIVIAAAIEMHSLHPLARAMMAERARRSLPELIATNVSEIIGQGITGTVDGKSYTINKSSKVYEGGILLEMRQEEIPIALFFFADQMKKNASGFLAELSKNYKIALITGDSQENADRLFGGHGMTIHARATPEKKFAIVKTARDAGERVIMIGDGLNDAPALALADAGIVFSGTENSASIEAASVAILGHDLALVTETLAISRKTTKIALQSIGFGIGLSLIGMGFAAAGFITPILAATIQEIIDVGVTINALRASR